jgi:superoxide dismutase, Cu-Zn family
MPRVVTTSILSATVASLVVACGGADETPDEGSGEDVAAAAEQTGADDELAATLLDPAGTEVGSVSFDEEDGAMEVSVDVTGLPPGFHGLHVHAIGVCEPDSVNPSDPSMTGDFLSAGGHIGVGDADHGAHPGDLPILFVAESGTGSMTAVTDALAPADLMDDDGSAVVLHAERDNYGNVPERYAAGGPDETTLNTGDAGGRIACGPVESSR